MSAHKNKRSAPRKRPTATERLRQQAREVYRDAILDAAAAVLADRGFAATRMQDVARRAGLATGTLYNYFTNKDELTFALMERGAAEFAAALAAMRAALGRTDSIVEAVVRVALGHIERHKTLFAMFEEGALSGGHASIARCSEIGEVYRGATRDALAAAQARGELRKNLSPDQLEILLGGMLTGMARAWLAQGAGSPLGERAPLVVDVFLHGTGRSR